MSDDTDTSDGGRWRPLGLAWYHWLLVLVILASQLRTTNASSPAGLMGYAVGGLVGSILFVLVLVAVYDWLQTKLGSASELSTGE